MNDQLDLFQESLDSWENEIKSTPTREADFDTLSGEHQNVCYFPDKPDSNYMDNLGFPGQFPLPEAYTLTCIEVSFGPCANFAGLEHRKKQTKDLKNY